LNSLLKKVSLGKCPKIDPATGVRLVRIETELAVEDAAACNAGIVARDISQANPD